MEIDFIKMTLSLTTEKVQKIIKTFSGEKEPSQESFCNSSGIDSGCRSPILHYVSSATCKDSAKISSATTNCASKGKKELSVSNNIKH